MWKRLQNDAEKLEKIATKWADARFDRESDAASGLVAQFQDVRERLNVYLDSIKVTQGQQSTKLRKLEK